MRPEFDLPQWKGLKLERPDARIHGRGGRASTWRKLLVEVRPRWKITTGPIEPGHFATLTLRAIHDGQQISQLTEETIEVKPTLSLADAKLEGFDKLLIGKKAGDIVETKVTISRRIGERSAPRQGSRRCRWKSSRSSTASCPS